MAFSSVYPHYLNKITRKGRHKNELLSILNWLTGYTEQEIESFANDKASFKVFFDSAHFNPKAFDLKGSICGYRIEDIEWPYTRKVRILDKLVDDLAKGKPLANILS